RPRDELPALRELDAPRGDRPGLPARGGGAGVRFETPAAFWALASLLLLILFSLWRQAAARVTVPSLALWLRIPERTPPVRALRRPKWRFELLLQALAIAAAVAALAGPYRETQEPQPRRVA